jgi:hypothetical protein
MRRALLCIVGLGVAACPAPSDLTPLIHVDPHAAARLDWLASHRAAKDAPKVVPARVHVMKDGEQLGGPNAVGRPGDLLLENDEVVFVIDQLGSSAGFAESGGNLVDAADAHARKDELGQMFTYFGTFPRQGVYDTLASGTGADGSAWAEAKGRELYEARLAVTTRYTLHAPDRALLLETTIENLGDAPVELPSVGDAIQWGGAEKIAPGKARGFKGPSSGPYVGGVGRFTSYAVTSTEGDVEAVSGGSWTDTAVRKNTKLAPREKLAYARIFVVGERADTSSLVAELAMAAGQPVGAVKLDVHPGLPHTVIHLTPEGGSEGLTLGEPFEGMLPVGRYTIAPLVAATRAAAGDSGPTPIGPIDVKADAVAGATVPSEPAASLEVQCRDAAGPMPCKVTVEGRSGTGTPDPDFGPRHAAGPAGNQVTDADGTVVVALRPGSYHVTASRGPEYALAGGDVDLAPRDTKSLVLSPSRVVDTAGYLACDFHQHTMLGADAPVSTVDRVVSNAAEGLEVAVASEHNVVADLAPLVREMHLEGALVEIAGDELTTDASRKPWGHANVWPLAADPGKPRGGAPPVRDRTAHELFEALRSGSAGPAGAGADFVLQINHPRTGVTGYFDQLKFDRARGEGTEPGYDPAFDALEVWNGRNVDARPAVIDDWRALLRTSHPVTATADTDTHGIVGQEAGYPRTMVRVDDDGHLAAWDASRTADLVRGVKVRRDVVLTNGPMLRVTANGAPIGGIAKGRVVTVKVHVECAPWIEVDTVRVMRAREGAADADKEPSKAVTLAPTKSGARAADAVFVVRADADDALFVVASGKRPMAPVLAGDPKEIAPWAMTGAIWVDADGDGKSLGR